MNKKVVYLAGPYSDTTKEGRDFNVKIAARVAKKLWMENKMAVICPHLNTYGFEGNASLTGEQWTEMFQTFLTGDFSIIARCDAVIMLPGWPRSKGACAEFIFAKWYGIPVYLYPKVP